MITLSKSKVINEAGSKGIIAISNEDTNPLLITGGDISINEHAEIRIYYVPTEYVRESFKEVKPTILQTFDEEDIPLVDIKDNPVILTDIRPIKQYVTSIGKVINTIEIAPDYTYVIIITTGHAQQFVACNLELQAITQE